VHRGAEESFDISADLRELAETPVTVVAAGAKAILDLPKTLEVLETSACRSSPWGRTPSRLLVARQRAEGAAPARQRRGDRRRPPDARGLGLPGGQLVANPIPAEAEIPSEMLAP
jgi:pseudouridine-5'-phosphate glycosidase